MIRNKSALETQGNPVVSIDNVAHNYGTTEALKAIKIDFPARKMVGLIGPDGVGKSTLLGLIAGVRKIQQGKILVFGNDIGNLKTLERQRNDVSYMPQGLGKNLYPTLSVFENIDFFGRLFALDETYRKERIHQLLVATSLDEFRERPAGKLSGGMKQKLSLCCALMNSPDLLILDEPTTGVDPLSRRQFWELIDSLREQSPNMSVLVATAYLDEAQKFDWIVAMDEGNILATGTPQELCERTGTKNLDDAFIELLPDEKKKDHQTVLVPERSPEDQDSDIIEAEHLTRRFGDFTAVKDVSFKIKRGEIFGFLGSNGCGKSTTMKMLTGLLPASEGTAKLFGKPVEGDTLETRQNVGYMSQSFSLYSELTVRQNLKLHARLYHLPKDQQETRVAEVLKRFGLSHVEDERPDSLPLGIKQRLQLAVAVLHNPPLLILDEPTSGVDPIARDSFWSLLIDLSRNDGVTIFISTHFMNEAERCDRISLMHAGTVLTIGSPKEITEEKKCKTLEEAFIKYLEEASGIQLGNSQKDKKGQPFALENLKGSLPLENVSSNKKLDFGRLWAYSRRETVELIRDPIRMLFALFGPIILMLAFGFGISFDIDNIKFAVFDQDRTPESREFIGYFENSRYFSEVGEVHSLRESETVLQKGEAQLILEIPPDFGKSLLLGNRPIVAVWLNGSMPMRAETIQSYISALSGQYMQKLSVRLKAPPSPLQLPTIESRFRYNQSFKSINAMVPSVLMLMLLLTPAIMSAIAVVREKETGSISNFYSTPITKFEFLVGKLLPYIGAALVELVLLLIMAYIVFGVPVKGSFITLIIGSFFYICATTGFGQLISTFTKTQVAAVFATSILSIVPAVNFSGLLVPVSSLSGSARIIGLGFPSAWYQPVSIGTFTKSLGMAELINNIIVLAGFSCLFLMTSLFFLSKQEK